MSSNAQDDDFDEYDKPGAERSRRRRGEDDDLQSDLEEELLEDDWFSGKKPSEASDEELNDDLLQSDDDDDDVNMSGQDVSLNATYSLGTSYEQEDNSQEATYTDDGVNLGYEEGDVEEEGYQQEYTEEYGHDDNAEMPEDQMDYTGEFAEGEDGYQDAVIDIQINEPLDGEFQDTEDLTSYDDEHGVAPEEEEEEDMSMGGEEKQEEEEAADTSQVENEAFPEEGRKEESDEEDEEDEESGRLRFKSERKDAVVVRLADAGSKRRNIPETLELSEKAKRDLREFEEQERQKRQNRYGGRGGRGGGGGGRGGRGRGGFPGFGMGDFRGGHRGRMNDNRVPLMGNMGMQQPSSRMPPPHQQQLQSQQHHPSRPRGPPPFQDLGRPLAQQPLQPLIPPHMTHRSPPLRPQMEPPSRMMSPPPPNFPQHHQQPPQPKNIHINPHFRGPTSSSVQVPLMPPAQSQSRPAVGPQRFPGPGDFQQHMPDNFGQPHRPPHHMEPYRNQPPQGPQDREPLFMPERAESTHFPGPHMFDHPGPSPLMNSNIHHQQQLPGPGHMGFGPPGPTFNQPGQGPLGVFPREPPRPNHPPHQGHQGMVGINQQDGPPNQSRPFMSPRQVFGQQGNLFPPPPVQFGMQGLMHGPPVSQLPHHDSLSPHQPMHHQQQHPRQELPHHHHPHHHHPQQANLGEPRPMMHHGQNPFHQQQGHGSPRQMTPRPQNPQQRIMSNKQRMNTPLSKQMQQRNSNLRELPVAPGSTSMNTAHPLPSPAARPVAKATQEVRPGQNTQPVPDHGRGRGQVAAKTKLQPGGAGRTVVRKEIPSRPSSTEPQDPNEDEETRQYRLKIEEQKRLREEILKRKEMRRQMQAGVRKKELLERLNSQTPNTQSPGPTLQIHPVQQNQQTPHPVQQQQQQPELKQQEQLQPQQQKQFPQRPQQSLNQSLKNPNQVTTVPPNGAAQIVSPRPNVKARLQMVKGGAPLSQIPGPGPQQNQLQQQQLRTSAVQNVNRPGNQVQKNIPVIPLAGPGQAQVQSQEPKPGAKRTVMQRAKNSGIDSQQVPQKVRVFKVSGATVKGPVASGVPVASSLPVQQQSTCTATAVNQGVQRKVTMTGQQVQGPGGTPQACQGGTGNPQQNRVVVSGRGRGRGGGQMGRGRPVSTRQSQRVAESQRCTVSIEGLSSSTTEAQLRNLLRSIGPIQMFKMMPQQRKAVAKFSSPEHAANFQMSFHRHMIDLSHIDVSLIDG